MPALTRLGLYGGPRAAYVGFSAAGAVIALTGTITSATEADIVTGGKTLILTVANDTFVTTDGSKTGIIAGLDSAGAEATGWDTVVKAGLGVSDVAFSVGDTVCTITLPPFAAYDISANETITATVPAASLTGGVETEASPTFTVSYIAPVTARTGGGGGNRRTSRYPRRVMIDGMLHWVQSVAEERKLLAEYARRVEAEALTLALTEAPKAEVAKARVKVVRAQTRVESVDTREADWLEYLRAEDDEILTVVFH